MGQAAAIDPRELEMEAAEILQAGEVREAGIRYLRPRQVELGHGGKTLQGGELFISRLSGNRPEADGHQVGILRKSHDPPTRLVDGGDHGCRQLVDLYFFLGLVAGAGGGCPFRSLVDPARESSDLGLGERVALIRHDVIIIGRKRDALDEETLGRFAGLDGLAALAALQGIDESMEAQLGLGLLFSMALETLGLEHRQHFLGEINLLGAEGPGRGKYEGK